MLTFSLLSSSLMTAVFLASLMSWRSWGRPGLIVRTFQHPSFRAGLFFDIFLLLLPGALVDKLLVGYFLISMHPMKKADHGRTTPYWLGAAQLEAGSSCPMRHEDLSHHQKQPLVPHSMLIE